MIKIKIDEIDLEIAHKLELDYKSKCQSFHGHTLKIKNIMIEQKYINDLDKNGMIIDFSLIKSFFDKYDHKTFLQSTKKNKFIFLKLPYFDIIWFDFNPTSENLLNYFVKELEKKLNIIVIHIELYETKTNSAVYDNPDIR